MAVPGGGLPEAGSRARSSAVASARVAALGILAVVGASAVCVAASARGRAARAALERPRAPDGRCVVYTYFEDQGLGDAAAVEVWRDVWAEAGWDPVVLSQNDAARHPLYDETVARVSRFPTTNPEGYETACYLRYLAMAAVGGGFMTDYDVVNVNVPPPPTCDWLPNGGAFTTHQRFVPSLATGTAAEFDRVARAFRDVDVDDVLRMSETEGTQISDMILDLYLYRRDEIRVAVGVSGSPAKVLDPPCDNRGAAQPLLFHFSHALMDELGQTDRPATMRVWTESLRDASRQCERVPAEDVETYAERFFAPPGANEWNDASELVRACEGDARCGDATDLERAKALIASAVDKRGRPITRTMEDRHVTP